MIFNPSDPSNQGNQSYQLETPSCWKCDTSECEEYYYGLKDDAETFCAANCGGSPYVKIIDCPQGPQGERGEQGYRG
jgi:hypothetical protein